MGKFGRRLGSVTGSGEQGTSLIELVVGITLMAIFGGMFTGAIVAMYSAMNKAQAVNLSSSQLNQSFLVLDKTVRYATAISPPGQGTSTDWYVELRTTNTGSEVCTQLRVDSNQLQERTWTVVNGAASGLTSFRPLASNISNGNAVSGASNQPFVLKTPAANSAFQQMTVNLTSPAGSGASLTTSLSSFTFTALNSAIPVPTAPICQQQVRP